MKSEWREYVLGNVCSRLSSGKSIKSNQIQTSGSYEVYGGNGLRGFTSSYNFDGDCAIVGRQGAYCGNVRYFSGKAYMTEHAVIICANKENNTRYLTYLLSTMDLGRLSGQSAQPGLSVKTLSAQRIMLPPLEIQEKVSYILSALDDKIAINTAINENLEKQAYLLFEQMLKAPHDETCLMSDIAIINPRYSISKGTEARYIDMSQLSTTTSFPNDWSFRGYNGGMKFRNKDTIFARITPCLENGKTAYIDFLANDEIAFGSTEYIVLSPKGNTPPELLYCIVRYPEFRNYATVNMNGSSGRQRVSSDIIEKYELPLFSDTELSNFHVVAKPLFNQITENSLQNRNLTTLRDTLLPKLMNGEIDVSNIKI